MSVSLENWLKNIEDEITNEIKRNRAYDSYFFRAFYDTNPFYIVKYVDKPRIVTQYGATFTEIPSPNIKLIRPEIIDLKYPSDWRSFYEKQTIMLTDRMSRQAILLENTLVFETLMKNIEEIEIKSADFNEIRRAQEIIESHNKF